MLESTVTLIIFLYVIISTMFSQFLAPESHLFLVMWITTVFTLNNLLAFCLWGYVGDRLLSRFRQDSNERRLNIALGCVLVGVALWMLFKLVEH